MSRCQLSAYDACVTDCRNTGAETTDNGRRVLDNFTRMSCEQLAAELRAASTAPSASPPASPPAAPPPAADPAGGRWVSPPHQAYTNAAMVSADFYLDVTLTSSGSFRGTWARYICAGAAYAGVLSCGKGPSEGTATGQLDRTGAGWIDLERLGRSNLRWTLAAGEIQMELPRTWQGDNVAFRSRIKR